MSCIAILEMFYEYKYVKYFTIRLEIDDIPEELSETDKFYKLFGDESHSHFGEFTSIINAIHGIGHYKRGAELHLFRFEDAANALPPPKKEANTRLGIEIVENSELRLYCIRLTNEVVILINGGVKTADQALNCPNVAKHFRFAQSLAKAVDELIRDGGIKAEGKEIVNYTGGEEIIFYL